MIIENIHMEQIAAIRLNPGDDVLCSLRKAVAQLGIRNGLILNGTGSVRSHHHHVVSTGVNPPDEIYVRASAPADVVAMSGMVLDGKVHAHIVFSNDKVAYGGHLEEGTTVLTFMAITIARIGNSLTGWDSIGALPEKAT